MSSESLTRFDLTWRTIVGRECLRKAASTFNSICGHVHPIYTAFLRDLSLSQCLVLSS